MPLSTLAPRLESVHNLTHMAPEMQARFLLQREAELRVKSEIDNRVYLLRGKIEDVLARIEGLEEAAFDIDGTLTGIGQRELFEENIAELNRLKATGMETTALTGRHYYQVQDLWERHPEGTGLDTWYVEQGFYKTGPDQDTTLFVGTQELEDSVGAVRATIAQHLPHIMREFGVEFETTSLRGFPQAHRSMVSYDALIPGTLDKITDPRIHDKLLEHFRLMWSAHDPENIRAKTGTSSIGTYEWTTDGLSKETTMVKHLEETGRASSRIAFLGDSGNDEAIFRSEEPYLKGVIINPHTKQALIENADIATVGIGNASPILRLMNRTRQQL